MQGPTLTTSLPKPHVSPQITRQGESGGFPDCKDMISALTSSNSRYPVGTPLSIDFWDRICGVSACAAGWGIKTLLTSDASHAVRVTHTSDQVTKSGSFHGPTSMLNISIELATELRKTYTYCPQNNIQEKTQKQCNGRAMEGKERVGVCGAFMPQRAQHPHITTIGSHP